MNYKRNINISYIEQTDHSLLTFEYLKEILQTE